MVQLTDGVAHLVSHMRATMTRLIQEAGMALERKSNASHSRDRTLDKDEAAANSTEAVSAC